MRPWIVLGLFVSLGVIGYGERDRDKTFDDVVYHVNLLVRFLATQGTDLYYLSHPTTHRCLERETCLLR